RRRPPSLDARLPFLAQSAGMGQAGRLKAPFSLTPNFSWVADTQKAPLKCFNSFLYRKSHVRSHGPVFIEYAVIPPYKQKTRRTAFSLRLLCFLLLSFCLFSSTLHQPLATAVRPAQYVALKRKNLIGSSPIETRTL